jgi:biotin operon repressor
MDKGEWYSRPAIADLSDVSKRQVIKLVDQLVADGVLVKRRAVHGEEFSLAVTESKNPFRPLTMRVPASPVPYESKPTVAGAAYRPKWKPMRAYDQYARSHQQLCEELR